MNETLPFSGGPVLIVGGGGFLGTNLTELLTGAGRSVLSYSRSWLSPQTSPLERRILAAPERVAEDLRTLAAEASCVFHMAHSASPASPIDVMAEDLSSSMALSFAVMAACEAEQVPMVYLSSGGAIYGQTDQIPTPETAPTYPISPYGAAKLTAERYLNLRGRLCGLDYRVVRISNPYGPWQTGQRGQGVIGRWMGLIRAGQPLEIWGDGTVVRDYLYISDVSAALLAALSDRARHQVFNIGSGEGVSLNQIVNHLREICGDAAVSVQYRDAAPSHVPVSVLDTERARNQLDWTPRVPLTEGLTRTWAWVSQGATA